MPRDKAYCAVMDNANIFITISAGDSYVANAPNLFGGSIERTDGGDDRKTLQREIYEESQTQIRIEISRREFGLDEAFVHPEEVQHGANANAFYYQNIEGCNYNCYLIDMTKGAPNTTVTITPGCHAYTAFEGAGKWNGGIEQPDPRGDFIRLKTKRELSDLGRGKSNEERGGLFGKRSISWNVYKDMIWAYTDATYIISIPRHLIRSQNSEEVLAQCRRISGISLEPDRSLWVNFYSNAFDALCRYV